MKQTDNDDDLCNNSDSDILYMHDIKTVHAKSNKWFVKLVFAPCIETLQSWIKQETERQLDSGASVNVMGYRDFLNIMQDGNAKPAPSKAKLSLYDGTILTPLGQCVLQAEYQGQRYQLEFQIVNSRQKPLLSASTCEYMKLVTLHTSLDIHTVRLQDNRTLTGDNYKLAHHRYKS